MAGSGPGKGKHEVALDETVAPDGVELEETVAPDDTALDSTVAASDTALDSTVAASDTALDSTVAASDTALDSTVAATEVALEATVAATAAMPTSSGKTTPSPPASRSSVAPTRSRVSGTARATLARGDELGRYVVLEMLGAGGMGEVYTAYDPELDRKIAVKVIRERSGGALETVARSRLLAEAQALARLSHPNVVTVYDVGTVDDGDVYIAMEFIEGITFSEWLQRGERDWQQIVATLVEAGRGLAAAHEAGLTHRDFKPDNVLIGSDGRVRVIDFGVALQDENAVPVIEDVERRELSPTTTGGLVGTPAYMAPEQFDGLAVGPGADQFAFGITLYQALNGRLPFDGKTLLTLAENVKTGEVREFSKECTAPTWLRELAFRTLEVVPERRFESMEVLLDELAPKVQRSRWPVAVAIIAILFVGIGVAALMLGQEDEPCQGFADELGSVWGTTARAEVEKGLGPGVFARVAPVLDDYGKRWTDGKRSACRATRVSQEQPERVLQLRNSCLDTRLRELDATITILASGLDKAEETAAALPSLSRCDNLAALESGEPAPDAADPKVVQSIESGLVRARALNQAGKYDEGMEVGQKVEGEARRIGWESAVSRALTIRGVLEGNLGDPGKSRETIFEAVRFGASSGDAVAEAEAWIQLVLTESSGMGDPRSALRWAKHAEIALTRAGLEQELKAKLAFNRASAHRLLGKNDEALFQYRESKALFEHALGPEHFMVARTRGAIATMLRRLGKREEAEAEFRTALARMEELFGPESPTLTPILNNLALLLRERDQFDDAMKLFERALDIKKKSLGPEHPSVATTLLNMALLSQRRGDFEKVELLWERSHAIRVKALKEDHPKVTWSLYWKVLYHFNRGQNRQALELAKMVILRHKARQSGKNLEMGGALAVVCDLHRRLGNFAKAGASCRQSQELFVALAAKPAKSIYPDIYALRIELDRGRADAAGKLLSALRLKLAEIPGDKRVPTGYLDFAEARLAVLRGDSEKARSLAGAARKMFETQGAGYGYYTKQVDDLISGLR